MNAFDAEYAVLGGCMLGADAYWQIADLLGSDDFSRDDTRGLWETLSGLARSGSPLDAVTVGDKAPKFAVLAVECANATPGATNIRAYAEIVSREAITRRVRAGGARIAKLSGADSLGEAQRIIASCAPRMASAIRPVSEFLKQSVATMAERVEATEILTGVPTSFDWLDETLSGWQREDLIVVGARPSVGKTALAVQASVHAALAGHPVLFLSLEMSGRQLSDRMLAHQARVDMQHVRQPKQMDEAEWQRIGDAGVVIGSLPLRIDQTSGLRVGEICARVRQADAMQRLGLVVIDYATHIKEEDPKNLVHSMQITTRTLKAMAKDLRVPVLLLSQLNRDGDARPTMRHLRESGAIEQDADVIVFLHRPDATKRELIEMIVAKQRNGPIGETFLHFNGATQRFTPTDERPSANTRSTGSFK